ncbi:MAG: pilus assembly protein [Anaerolineaceae bacterium]|nr:pilus assembly protein [Anaerolineaceae bacterium]
MEDDKKTNQKGQAIVEFALIITIMVIMVGGIVDLGRAFAVYINLRDAVEDGVIYGSMDPTGCEEITKRVLSNVDNSPDVTVEILIDNQACDTADPDTEAIIGKEIRVNARYSGFQITMPLMGTLLGTQTMNINSTMTGTILSPMPAGGG